jgi:2-keto-4-pentenoate hydratase/2-oxohepta-3-ene-1,7-dioic acid hydratase in catechol pathway
MKLATFSHAGRDGVGAVIGDRIIPLEGAVATVPFSMLELIDLHRGSPSAELEAACEAATGESLPLSDVRLLAPIARPGKILAIGLNYADHIAESGLAKPETQLWFAKLANTVAGPFDSIPLPRVSQAVDYEVELVAVIGTGGRNISMADASSHVFGYCVGNDVSARDWQQATPQWMLGKSFDGHGPFGPWITTADEVGDPHRLAIRCLVNGEVRQESTTANLVFNVWEQIAHVSKVMTLEPGDIIFTGTPGGVGAAAVPPRYLGEGDIVRCEIDGLGYIENRCLSEQ